MIPLNFPRLTIMVRNALIDRLLTDRYQITYRKLIFEFQESEVTRYDMNISAGKTKVDDKFPTINIESVRRTDQWVALSHGKEIEFEFKLSLAVKSLSSPKSPTSPYNAKGEDYLLTLADFTIEALNEPGQQQMEITLDQDRVPLEHRFFIHDSMAESANFVELYSGAIRAAVIPWSCKMMFVGGNSGLLGAYNGP